MKSETIAEMIAELGAPRNLAEQALINEMRQNAEWYETTEAERQGRYVAWSAWTDALATKHAIIVFRQCGTVAVIPGVYGVSKVEVPAAMLAQVCEGRE